MENIQIKVCARKLEVIVPRRTMRYQLGLPEIVEGRFAYLRASFVAVTTHLITCRFLSGTCYSQ